MRDRAARFRVVVVRLVVVDVFGAESEPCGSPRGGVIRVHLRRIGGTTGSLDSYRVAPSSRSR